MKRERRVTKAAARVLAAGMACWLMAGPAAGQEAARGGLRIYVLQGEQAVNNVRTGTATAPVVEVRDANDFPVAGAEVTFRTPERGASATFEGGRREYTNRTDAKGQVSAGRMTPTGEGVFSIQVLAKMDDRTGMAVIRQRNSRDDFSSGGAPGSQRKGFWGRNKWWLMGLMAGTGAGLGYWLATRDTTPSEAVLKPGTVVIGGPR